MIQNEDGKFKPILEQATQKQEKPFSSLCLLPEKSE